MAESEPLPHSRDLLPEPLAPETDDPESDSGGSWESWLPGRAATEHGETYSDHARAAFVDRSGGVGAVARARLKRRRDPGNDSPRERGRGPALLVMAGVAVVVVVVLTANLGNNSPKSSGPSKAAPASTVAATPAAPATTEGYPHATTDCYPTKTADAVVGAGPGDPGSGPGAILGFEWAYYADRSGARARDWVSADAAVPDAAAIQAGIDSVPVTTKYCVHISKADGAADTWNVVLSEQFPTDTTPQQWAQTITTRTDHGRVLITAIRKNP
ncbi:hypothetical protein [Nocardia sp. NPDC046763]|uniref:hypothetical protein n=1 Tax=Nocardia sp. NPDC046763 TaxID=3155256 RepID=UPI00340D217C